MFKKAFSLVLFLLIVLLIPLNNCVAREKLLMDFGWKFHLGSATDVNKDFHFGAGEGSKAGGANGAAGVRFDVKDWEDIKIPHDWVAELGFMQEAEVTHGYRPVGRNFPDNSIGWYRKTFEIPSSDAGKRIYIEFDGIYRNPIIWVNGHFLGNHISGYTSFQYDITDYLNYGGKNVLSVRVDASLFEGWFYEGAGIYRHVWLLKTDPLYVKPWGTFVTNSFEANDFSTAETTIKTKISNKNDRAVNCTIISTIVDNDGNKIAETTSSEKLPELNEYEFVQKVTLKNPKLWSPENPNLYKLITTVKNGENVADICETTFGVRDIKFDKDSGLYLNGKPFKIKGVCCHQDHAGVGVAVPDRLQEYRIEKLKELGCNAYRCSHNPPAPEILDACDRLGLLVMDETRLPGTTEEVLGQFESMIIRDRNHPSIFIWSLGNEEMVIEGNETGGRIFKTMKNLANMIDPSRQVTLAMDSGWGSPVSEVLDVQGFNYLHGNSIEDFHKKFPNKPVMMSESSSALGARGNYVSDLPNCYFSAYDVNFPEWGESAEKMWTFVDARPFVAGTFVWTGFDYHGEPTTLKWPCVNSNFGIMDICGFPKDNYYYYKSWWGKEPVVHLLPHWNWPGKEGKDIDVWCHSNCNEVELFLNGKSLGKKKMPKNSHLEWKVNYKPGKIEAKGYINGKMVAADKIETTGAPLQIKLTPDRTSIKADYEDLSMVTVTVVDEKGRIVPVANNEMTFKISANASIIGLGNGDPVSHKPEKGLERQLFNGYCQVIVQSSGEQGEIVLTAESPGLKPATVVIKAGASKRRAFVE